MRLKHFQQILLCKGIPIHGFYLHRQRLARKGYEHHKAIDKHFVYMLHHLYRIHCLCIVLCMDKPHVN
jgi:hypothetical protein